MSFWLVSYFLLYSRLNELDNTRQCEEILSQRNFIGTFIIIVKKYSLIIMYDVQQRICYKIQWYWQNEVK